MNYDPKKEEVKIKNWMREYYKELEKIDPKEREKIIDRTIKNFKNCFKK